MSDLAAAQKLVSQNRDVVSKMSSLASQMVEDEDTGQVFVQETDELLETSIESVRAIIKDKTEERLIWWKKVIEKKKPANPAGFPVDPLADVPSDKVLRVLRARKFDVDRAYTLLEAYYEVVILEDLAIENILKEEKVVAMFKAGSMSLPPTARDHGGRQILLMDFDGFEKILSNLPKEEEDNVVRCFWLLMEIALLDPETQRKGVSILVDFTASSSILSMMGFSMRNKPKMLELMVNRQSVRMGGQFIVHTPWWISMMMTIMSVFIKEKLRKRMHLMRSDVSEMYEYIDPECVPVEFEGGKLEFDPKKWADDVIAELSSE